MPRCRMLGTAVRLCCCMVFMLGLSLAVPTGPTTGGTMLAAKLPTDDVPAVDPTYIYDQLATIATRFQRREAGYDQDLPVGVNGHDEFADYWTREITHDLEGFGPQARRYPFATVGWRNRPPVVPAFNVEVTVPGLTHPEQVVIIGCHYDGMAFSTQSAYDDASGYAIELGVAKAMAAFWRPHRGFPARTPRFRVFHAEEPGVCGSHY